MDVQFNTNTIIDSFKKCDNPDVPEVFEDALPDGSKGGDGLDETSGYRF